MSDKLTALLDGIRNAATLGWGDELTPEIMGMLPAPDNEERIYAAGSPESDMRQGMLGASAELERRFPSTYHSGEALGAFPGMAALPAVGGIAGAGLIGGLLGAVKGAGGANGAPMAEAAARGAGPEALMGMGAAAVPGAASELKNMLGEMPRELEPALAGVQINQHNAINPPKGYGGDFKVPKASKPLVEEAMIPASEDLADLSYAANTKKAMGKQVPEAEIKALNKAKDKLAAGPQPEQPKTVRPPRRAPRVEVKTEAVQMELPGASKNVLTNQDKISALERHKDALTNTQANTWVQEGRSHVDPAELLQTGPQKNYEVGYRGMSAPKDVFDKIVSSSAFDQPTAASWSKNPETAKAFATGREGVPVLLRQTKTIGVPVGKNEGEILNGPRKFKVKEHFLDPEGIHNFDLE